MKHFPAHTRGGSRLWRRPVVQLVGVLFLVSGIAACSKSKDKDKGAKTAQSESSETATATKPAEPAIPDDAIPTEEDFEAEVEKQIKPESNLPAELDKIEKEIGD
jgi:hypothetical protein